MIFFSLRRLCCILNPPLSAQKGGQEAEEKEEEVDEGEKKRGGLPFSRQQRISPSCILEEKEDEGIKRRRRS